MPPSTRALAPTALLIVVAIAAIAVSSCDAGGDAGCTTEGDLTYCVSHEGDCDAGSFYCGEEFSTVPVERLSPACCPGGTTCCFWSDGIAGGFNCCDSVEACVTGADAGACE